MLAFSPSSSSGVSGGSWRTGRYVFCLVFFVVAICGWLRVAHHLVTRPSTTPKTRWAVNVTATNAGVTPPTATARQSYPSPRTRSSTARPASATEDGKRNAKVNALIEQTP